MSYIYAIPFEVIFLQYKSWNKVFEAELSQLYMIKLMAW